MRNVVRLCHETQQGYTEIHAVIDRALAGSRQWIRRRPSTQEDP